MCCCWGAVAATGGRHQRQVVAATPAKVPTGLQHQRIAELRRIPLSNTTIAFKCCASERVSRSCSPSVAGGEHGGACEHWRPVAQRLLDAARPTLDEGKCNRLAGFGLSSTGCAHCTYNCCARCGGTSDLCQLRLDPIRASEGKKRGKGPGTTPTCCSYK